MKRVALLFIIMLCAYPQTAAQSSATIIAPAVQRTPQGLSGVLSYVTVVTQEGSGHVYIDTWPLAEVDIQGSARLAVQVACEVVQKDWNNYDFFITVRSDSPIIGGPSAGGAMTVAVIAALQGWQLDPEVVMSGTINPDETVGPVGGLYQKAAAAAEVADLFLVPEGQTNILVEEQEVVQEGLFSYVRTVQREVDLIEEGKKIGLDVKEVYDIRDAVYYFTGKRIEIPDIEAEPIETDFMKSYAQEELDSIQREYTGADEKITAYSGKYQSDLKELLTSAQEQIQYAQETFSAGDYYTSMSASFVAGLYTTYAVNLLSFFEETEVEEIFSGLKDHLAQLQTEIKQERPLGMTALQCLAAAQKRIFEAKDYYQRAAEGDSDFSYIEYASYAQRRAESAEFWLSLAREYQKGNEISEPMLKNAASSMFSTAELSLVYASSILPKNDLLQEAQARLEIAQKEFVEKAYCASLFSAIESKIHSEVALLSYASKRETISQRVDRATEKASSAIEESRTQGIEPVLAVSYYELAESLENPIQSLIYLGYAEEVASIHKYIESQPETPLMTSEPFEIPKESSKSEEQDYGERLGFLLAGILVGVCLSWMMVKIFHRPE